jgi:hypothetical protein
MTNDVPLTLRLATQLADKLTADIRLARTRDEHVRVTARASEARRLLDELISGSEISEE